MAAPPSLCGRRPHTASGSTQGEGPGSREDRPSRLFTVEAVSSLTERPFRDVCVTRGYMTVKDPFLGVTDRTREHACGLLKQWAGVN